MFSKFAQDAKTLSGLKYLLTKQSILMFSFAENVKFDSGVEYLIVLRIKM